jgi:hypothetical protein
LKAWNPEINDPNTPDERLAALWEDYRRCTIDIERYRHVQQNFDKEKIPEDELRNSILDEAHIVFTTLSGSAAHIFGSKRKAFDIIIIDEAAQAVELSTLVPLMRNSPAKCILVWIVSVHTYVRFRLEILNNCQQLYCLNMVKIPSTNKAYSSVFNGVVFPCVCSTSNIVCTLKYESSLPSIFTKISL